MISCVVVSVLLFTNAVCGLADGPGVCNYQEMVKTEGEKQLVKRFCCEGYKKENGVCVDCPDCTAMVCPENYCGDTCIEMCDCPKHAYCDNLYCCICRPGLRGVFCNETCIHGYYGPGCKHKCTCQTQEKCDSVTGNCTSNTSTICSPDTASNNSLNSCSLLHDDMSETSGGMHVGYIVFIVAVSVGTFVFTFLSIYAKILQKIKVRRRKRNDSSMKKSTI
ncbi:N-acetylglucosamine-1-phosphodiester alpha-N-acetylglucosaminidase-like [Mytilus edulis]|uniref:N-acetylglucosamine-1-phosphodiester alpha-N-acetylglucosaminidase-like n=1 Tax=Mytilus edulis TaxID=6550 RepID=UPI0039EF533D